MKKLLSIVVFSVCLGLSFSGCCGGASGKSAADKNPKTALSLWNDDAPAKKALSEYVKTVTDKNSPDFIPVENRIAIFDMDGTLCCETHPTYFDFQMFVHRVLEDKSFTPDTKQLFIAENFRDTGYVPPLSAEYERTLASAYKDMTVEELGNYIRDFMETPQPGYKNLKRKDAFYKPMVQVVKYLTANDFTVYVSSGSDRFIVRGLAGQALNLPPHQLIGSDSLVVSSNQEDKDGLDYTFKDGDRLVMGGKNLVKNLQMNKVVTIIREIGVQPVLGFGNSLTDASMVNYAMYGNKYKSLGFMLCCDDTDREYGNPQKAEKMLASCKENGWIPVSMKNDWKTIYGDDVEKE